MSGAAGGGSALGHGTGQGDPERGRPGDRRANIWPWGTPAFKRLKEGPQTVGKR